MTAGFPRPRESGAIHRLSRFRDVAPPVVVLALRRDYNV